MARTPTPLHLADLSAFARTLGRTLAERQAGKPAPPSHLELLNLIARAAGHRNLQALQAAALSTPAAPAAGAPSAASAAAAAAPPAAAPALSATARKALQQFDAQGRLQRWPARFAVQRLAMWVLWTRFDAKRRYTEREVNAILRQANTFGDHVTLRRELINHRLMTRKSDCSDYRKVAARPDDEARALLTAYRAAAASPPVPPTATRPPQPRQPLPKR
ncbi:MAG: DUF2087 domain-containing protein [Proteobacteria bacterium]|nr:DUF2087 domain-containing protein [Pseudomonadota bacterium]